METSEDIQNETNLQPERDIKLIRKLVCLGLFVGDSLGATSEFIIPWEVGDRCIEKYPGWPGKLVGGGAANWNRGEPTDDSDMGIAIARAFVQSRGKLVPSVVMDHFLKWLRTGPSDVGSTTRHALHVAKTHRESLYFGAIKEFKRNPNGAANGSLMRNGIVPSFLWKPEQELDAIDATVCQGILTHFSALPSTKTTAPTLEDIRAIIKGPWAEWKTKTTNVDAKMWLSRIGKTELLLFEEQLLKELDGFETFEPYTHMYKGTAGYCIISLKIALWALHWSFRSDHVTIPKWLPSWPFERHGFETIMWVVMIGADADTYGAIAGPLLAAYHPSIPESLLEGLELREEVEKMFAIIQ